MMVCRLEHSISRPEMAKRLGMTQSALWKIEAGRTLPKQKTVERFCAELGISLAYMYIKALEEVDFFPPRNKKAPGTATGDLTDTAL